jgi:hypothetical protein
MVAKRNSALLPKSPSCCWDKPAAKALWASPTASVNALKRVNRCRPADFIINTPASSLVDKDLLIMWRSFLWHQIFMALNFYGIKLSDNVVQITPKIPIRQFLNIN